MRAIFAQASQRDRYIRIVTWLLLAGVPAEQIQTEYPAIQAVRERAADEGIEERELLAAFALTYGWVVFGAQLVGAFDGRG